MLAMELKGIGVIHDLGNGRSLLDLRTMYAEGLTGLKAGAQVQVLYWMHQLNSAERRTLRVHPGGDTSQATLGVFSVRSCMRPNPIGVTVADVVEVRSSGLVVSGLDAHDGSPLIDIKVF